MDGGVIVLQSAVLGVAQKGRRRHTARFGRLDTGLGVLHHGTVIGGHAQFGSGFKNTSGPGLERVISVPSAMASKKPSRPICFRINFVFLLEEPMDSL